VQIRKRPDTFIVLALTALFIFICIRAAIVDITHDEAYSYYNIKNWWHVQFLCNANSHWINSLGMKLACIAGLEDPLPLRWLSLISTGIIMIMGFKWLRVLPSVTLKFFGFALFFLNPFVLDYFFLARGYVSAMALEVLCIYFFIRHHNSGERRFAFFALVCGGLSAVANFNFFYFFVAYCIVHFYTCYFKKGFSFLRQKHFYLDGIISLGFILLVLRALLFIKRCSNDFGLGGEELIASVWTSYVDSLLYLKVDPEHRVLYYIAVVCFLLSLSAILYGLFNFKRHRNNIYFFSALITSIMFFFVLFNHFCFDVLYPTYRSTLPYFPLLAVNVSYFFMFSFKDSAVRKWLLNSVSFFLLANFISTINLKYTFDFNHSCETKDALELLKKTGAKKVGFSPQHFGVFINYYQQNDKLRYPFYGEKINTFDAGPDSWWEETRLEDFDYILTTPPYNMNYYKDRKVQFETVAFYPITKSILIKVKKAD
jgi:hypothetical protein